METMIETLCESLMNNVAAKQAYAAIKAPVAEDAEKLANSIAATSMTRKQLASALRRPVVYKGRKFYRDKTGQAHFCQLPSRKISPLGRIGVALAKINDGDKFLRFLK